MIKKIKSNLSLIGNIAVCYLIIALTVFILKNSEISFSIKGVQIIWPGLLEDIFKWTAAGSIATAAAFYATYKMLLELKKQVELEQEPYVVVKSPIVIKGNFLHLNVKNVGRGPALSVVGGTKPKDRNQAFFSDSEPHAEYFSAGKGHKDWKVDYGRLGEMQTIKEGSLEYPVFYLFYKSQLGCWYQTLVKIRELEDKDKYKVMENSRENF